VQNTVLIDLNIQREERDIMDAQEEEEREVQERLEWAKDMRLEEELEWQEKQIRMDTLALPFHTAIHVGHRGSHSSFRFAKALQRFRSHLDPTAKLDHPATSASPGRSQAIV